MIRWCSYCQRYLGECAPFDDYRLTHGICPRCNRECRWDDDERIETANLHRAVYERLRRSVKSGSPRETRAILDEAISLGFEPVDLAVGMLQPILREIGELWSAGEFSVAAEHSSTSAVTEMLGYLYTQRPDFARLRDHRPTEVLIVPAPENEHFLGVQMIGFFLHSHGIRCLALPESMSPERIVELVRQKRPRILGLSLAVPEHLRGVEKVWRALVDAKVEPKPLIVLGGYPLRQGLEVPAESPFIAAREVDDLRGALRVANVALAAD